MKRGSMQCRIPEDIREQLADDPFMRDCIIDTDPCEGRIEWNHGMQYAGRQVSVRVPVERDHGFRSKMITQSGGT